jgi:hypothetical protein
MSLLWIIVLVGLTIISSTGLCFYLLRKTGDVDSTVWILEHVICPIIRILTLLIIVSLVYPVISPDTTAANFWRVLLQEQNINHVINILFFGSLFLAFIPVVGHPALALPIQSCLSIALVFNWQYSGSLDNAIQFMPPTTNIIKIVLYLIVAYFITTRSSILLSRWIDTKLVISGSIRLVSDSIYLTLQIPVMLMYCAFLGEQLLYSSSL